MEQLCTISAEQRWRPTGTEVARQTAPNPKQTRAREVRDVIMQDNVDQPLFPWASQNVIATCMLPRDLPEPEDHEGCRKVARLRALLEREVFQQVESSAAWDALVRSREPPRPQRDNRGASSLPFSRTGPQSSCGSETATYGTPSNTQRRACEEEKAARGRRQNDYKEFTSSRDDPPRRRHPHRGGRYDDEED
jgi:hypothetical protein